MSGPAETRAHLRGPWVYAPASEEGSAVVSPPTEGESADPWWTAIIDCADDDVANDIARLMHAAPELLAVCIQAEELLRDGGVVPIGGVTWHALCAAINRATGDAT